MSLVEVQERFEGIDKKLLKRCLSELRLGESFEDGYDVMFHQLVQDIVFLGLFLFLFLFLFIVYFVF